MFKVIEDFKDLNDGKIYRAGDEFPSTGKSKERIEELSSAKNKLKKVLIEEVKEKKPGARKSTKKEK